MYLNNIPRNLPFCCFVSFLTVLFKITNVATLDLKVFLWIGASFTNAAVNSNYTKALLGNGWRTLLLQVIQSLKMVLPKNSPNCPIFCS